MRATRRDTRQHLPFPPPRKAHRQQRTPPTRAHLSLSCVANIARNTVIATNISRKLSPKLGRCRREREAESRETKQESELRASPRRTLNDTPGSYFTSALIYPRPAAPRTSVQYIHTRTNAHEAIRHHHRATLVTGRVIGSRYPIYGRRAGCVTAGAPSAQSFDTGKPRTRARFCVPRISTIYTRGGNF